MRTCQAGQLVRGTHKRDVIKLGFTALGALRPRRSGESLAQR
ncbi:hypothetical protein AB0P36_32905 [Streptomyces flavidovirens]